MTKEILSVSDLTKRFGNIVALDRLTLSMSHGIFGLIGPNGAGKTTLLRVLLGLIKADGGEANVLGLDVNDESFDIRRRVGVLHEHPIYPPSLTAGRYLERVSRLYDARGDPSELLELVGLLDAKQRKIGDLSAGMRQRLGVAQALIGKPDLVFLDEPTSNLDVIGRTELLRTILHVHESAGVSFCIISHVLSELERICSDVAFINAGRAVVVGPLHEVISKFAANQYSIVVSNPRLLCAELKNIDCVVSAEVAGIKTVTVIARAGDDELIQSEIERLAKLKGVEIYQIAKASSLEQAFLEVMRGE